MPALFELPESPTLRLLGQLSSGLDPRSWSRERPVESLALGYGTLRSGLFAAESVPLFWLQRPDRSTGALEPPPPEALEATVARLQQLLARDAALFGEGLVPLSALAPRDPLGHGTRLVRILLDAAAIAARKQARRARDFSPQARRWLDELPTYYRRNFHYQTDGYLSARSADLYEHQVELLFRGGADAMRRLILRPLRQALGRGRGRGLRLLELGCGTGTATRFVAKAFPEAKITCLDLSYPYLKHARRQLDGFDRLDFSQGDAAGLDFRDGHFDAVYSVFLFHELPKAVRAEVLAESRRVLRPGGFFGLVDSLQKGDDEALDWTLDVFPREFHEPYYAHYAANPMEPLLEEAGFESVSTETGYLAKVVTARAPASPVQSAS